MTENIREERKSMNTNVLMILNDLSVLVVEDDSIALLAIEQGIKPYVKKFYSASDGEEGLDIYKKNKIDIVVSDLHLPYLNGFDLIVKIRDINPNQQFIIITSYDNDQNTLKSIEHGAFAYMRKPLKIIDLQTYLVKFTYTLKSNLESISKDLQIDLANKIIYKNDKELVMTRKIKKLFWILYYNKNTVVSYNTIVEYVYDGDISIDALRMIVLRLKKILGDNDLIQNISSSGYMLVEK